MKSRMINSSTLKWTIPVSFT